MQYCRDILEYWWLITWKKSNSENSETVVDGIVAGIPMKRLATIEVLGELTVFLASNESSYITG